MFLKKHIILGKNVLFVILIVQSLIIVLLFGAFLVFRLSGDVSKTSEENNGELYKYYQFNPETKHSEVGFVTLLDEIDDDNDFITFKDDYGTLNLISGFGLEHYKCTGSCRCIEGDPTISRRIPGTITLSRGLVYLVAAVSTYFAVEHAKEYFQKECALHFEEKKDECISPDSRIESDVDDCESYHESTDADENLRKRFRCHGYCVKIQFYNPLNKMVIPPEATIIEDLDNMLTDEEEILKSKILQEHSDESRCDEMELSTEIDIDFTPAMQQEAFSRMMTDENGNKLSTNNNNGFTPFEEVAMKEFMEDQLDSHCRLSSFVKLHDDERMKEISTTVAIDFLKITNYPLCAGMGKIKKGKGRKYIGNPTVKCIEIRDFYDPLNPVDVMELKDQ